MAITRDDLYHKFGPILIEALALIIKDEINLLRAEHSLPERTNQQIMDAMETKLENLTPYDWLES